MSLMIDNLIVFINVRHSERYMAQLTIHEDTFIINYEHWAWPIYGVMSALVSLEHYQNTRMYNYRTSEETNSPGCFLFSKVLNQNTHPPMHVSFLEDPTIFVGYSFASIPRTRPYPYQSHGKNVILCSYTTEMLPVVYTISIKAISKEN